MNQPGVLRRLRARIGRRLRAPARPNATLGTLGDAEHAAVYALFRVICDDATFSAGSVRAFVDERTSTARGNVVAYRQSVALLDATARARFDGRAFAALSPEDGDAVLRALLRPFPHAEREPRWRRRTGLTSHSIDLLTADDARRRLRHETMRDLLAWYYGTAAGWAVVGWTDFPGRPTEWWKARK